MKVLQQLIEHFWSRGALSLEEAHYLVGHGFIAANHLTDYVPLLEEEEEDTILEPPAEPPAPPTEMELTEEKFDAPRSASRGGKAKPPAYDLVDLQRDLAEALAQREPYVSPLMELAKPYGPATNIDAAAIRLRQLTSGEFGRMLNAKLRTRPALLAELWECVSDEAFDALLEAPHCRGQVAREFRRLLQVSDPSQWGAASRLLKADEVRAVVNLMAVRRLVLAALSDLHRSDMTLLARCVQRPAHPGPAWKALALGLVLVHHGRAQAAQRSVSGYPMARIIDGATWKSAWATALAIDVAVVSNLMMTLLGPDSDLDSIGPAEGTPFLDHDLAVPYGWKV